MGTHSGHNRRGKPGFLLRPLSMVVCRYGLPGGGQGSITAIGPTRMEYSHTMAGVRFISSLMTELVSQVYG